MKCVNCSHPRVDAFCKDVIGNESITCCQKPSERNKETNRARQQAGTWKESQNELHIMEAVTQNLLSTSRLGAESSLLPLSVLALESDFLGAHPGSLGHDA